MLGTGKKSTQYQHSKKGVFNIKNFFKRSDTGFCPSYTIGHNIFWIQDKRIKHFNGGGDYEYYLMCRLLGRIEKNNFKWKNFDKLIKKLKLKKIENGVTSVFSGGTKEYLYNFKDERLVIIFHSKIIAGPFSTFRECFDYSEQYIQDKNFKDPIQLSFFDMDF